MKRLKLKPYVPPEFYEQTVVFEWTKLMIPRHPELKWLHSTLNGIRLPIGLAVKAKRAGNRKGVVDIFLDLPRNGYHGLRVELKRRQGGVLSNEQIEEIQHLRDEGYCVEVPKGADEAIICIKDYLGISDGY